MKANTKEVIYAQTERDESTGCLLWIGHTEEDGYGRVNFGGSRTRVHRLFYEWSVGPIPAGMTLDHICNVRNCVEVAHLEPCSAQENCRRAGERRVTCKRGHLNATYRKRVSTTGETYCSQCLRENEAKRKMAKRMAGG